MRTWTPLPDRLSNHVFGCLVFKEVTHLSNFLYGATLLLLSECLVRNVEVSSCVGGMKVVYATVSLDSSSVFPPALELQDHSVTPQLYHRPPSQSYGSHSHSLNVSFSAIQVVCTSWGSWAEDTNAQQDIVKSTLEILQDGRQLTTTTNKTTQETWDPDPPLSPTAHLVSSGVHVPDPESSTSGARNASGAWCGGQWTPV